MTTESMEQAGATLDVAAGDTDRLLTVEAAARYLGIPKATLYTWRTRRPGYGPRALRFGACLRYRVSELDRWLADRMESFTDDEVEASSGSRRGKHERPYDPPVRTRRTRSHVGR